MESCLIKISILDLKKSLNDLKNPLGTTPFLAVSERCINYNI